MIPVRFEKFKKQIGVSEMGHKHESWHVWKMQLDIDWIAVKFHSERHSESGAEVGIPLEYA